MDLDEYRHKVQGRLIGIVTALLFLYYADAKIEGASLVGAKVEFRNEAAILHFLWVFWTYYFIRSYQYFKEEGAREYSAEFDRFLAMEFRSAILGEGMENFQPIKETTKITPIKTRIAVFPKVYIREPTIRALTRQKRQVLRGGKLRGSKILINLLRVRRPWFWFLGKGKTLFTVGVQITVFPEANKEDSQGRSKQYIYLGPPAIAKYARALWRSVAMSTVFAETYVPLLIGLLPVWYVIAFR